MPVTVTGDWYIGWNLTLVFLFIDFFTFSFVKNYIKNGGGGVGGGVVENWIAVLKTLFQDLCSTGNKTGLQPVSRPVEQVPLVHPIYRETVFRRKKEWLKGLFKNNFGGKTNVRERRFGKILERKMNVLI